MPVLEVFRRLGALVVHGPSPDCARKYAAFLEEEVEEPAQPQADWPPAEFRRKEGDYATFARPSMEHSAEFDRIIRDRQIVPQAEPSGDDRVVATRMHDGTDGHIPLGQRQLFLDEGCIERIDKLEKTLHQPEKKGAVIRSEDPNRTIQTRSAPLWDTRAACFKFWMVSMDNPVRQSTDGLNWTLGQKPNFGSGGVSMVVYDGRDPNPERRYKAALLNTGFAVSPDGVDWQQLDVPAVQSQDEANFTFNEQENLFIHTVKRSGPHGRSVAVATSCDFEHWDDYGVVFHADEVDQEMGCEAIEARLANPLLQQTEYNTPEHYSVQIYNMGVFLYEGLYIGLPSMYHHTGKVPPEWEGFDTMRLSPYILDCVQKYGDYTGFYNIQVVCSRDLKDWTRVGERRPFIETSPLGAGAYDFSI